MDSGAPQQHGGRILVVDDEATMRRLLEKLLRLEGYDVALASSGEQALQEVFARGADTVLLDMRLPGMSGLDVCRNIRAHPRGTHTPIVFITAVNDRELRRKGMEAGADDFLSKPFDEVELLARIRNCVRVKRYYDNVEQQKGALARAVDDRTAELATVVSELTRIQNELRASHEETIYRLSRAAEFRDDETGQHLQRMSWYCHMIGSKIGLSPSTCELLRIASPMHDVGKLGIPDRILLKPGRLTPEEFTIMKTHAEIGYRILHGSTAAPLEMAAMIAHTHHEKWDGSGYPHGLRGEDIPLAGRIAAIADVFDALTSARPYKSAWPLEAALDLLRKSAGSHFDPHLVHVFLDNIDEVLAIRERFVDGTPAPHPEAAVVVH
ncbi:response regulator [Nannocystis bainbridge]|uniref:Two-component system response regulator n=1 Tax=Nannocystis bainbridge TaxID=2995303 RepID=A0ABT5E8W3_9BACT|nr:two-component system response regulator [Nannocystis bainbridge]MDC0722305.1 two-component system response regulator [Nannocystis bainbridge]